MGKIGDIKRITNIPVPDRSPEPVRLPDSGDPFTHVPEAPTTPVLVAPSR
jgi:hypothetical protein